MSFDPYYEWLSIPSDEQPADYYRLIGVRRFEPNRDVIRNAAERQMLLLKSLQGGPHSDLTQRVLNEVARARICLLDKRKRSQYDQELKRQDAERAGERASSRAPLFAPLEELTPLPSAVRLPPSTNAVAAPPVVNMTRTPSRAGRRNDRTMLHWSIAGMAVAAVTPLLMWLLVRGVGQSATDSSGQLVASRALAPQPGNAPPSRPELVARAPVNQPPVPPVFAPPPEEFALVENDARVDATPSKAAAEQRVVTDPPGGSSGDATTGDVVSQPPDPPASQEESPDQSYTARVRQKMKADRAADKQPPTAVTPEPAAPTTPGTFAQLPHDVDLQTALASAGQSSIVLGTLPASAVKDCRLAWEDFAQPDRGSHLILGDRQESNGRWQWPLIRRSPARALPLADDAPRQEAPVGRVELGPSRLELTITAADDPDLVEQLSCCILVIEKDAERHCIQFQKRQSGPPMELGFARAKEERVLDAMPTVNRLAADRVKLHILGLELDTKQSSPSSRLREGSSEWSAQLATDLTSLVLRSGRKELTMKLAPNLRSLDLRAGLEEDLTVRLTPDQECEIGVRLVADAQRLSVVVRPRYALNERKQGLVTQELEKDLARVRSQFADNQADLAKAQAQLKAIPQELKQLRKATPGSAQDLAYLQSRMDNLRVVGSKSEAAVRRLAPLLPAMASDIERMELLLVLVGEMAHRLRLRFRVVAAGEFGDLVLFETASGPTRLK